MHPALPALVLAAALAANAADGADIGHGSESARAYWESLTAEQRAAVLARHRKRLPAAQAPTAPAEAPPVQRERRYEAEPWGPREEGWTYPTD